VTPEEGKLRNGGKEKRKQLSKYEEKKKRRRASTYFADGLTGEISRSKEARSEIDPPIHPATSILKQRKKQKMLFSGGKLTDRNGIKGE